jgi:hypothetical protein
MACTMASAIAQELAPSGPGPWSFEEIIVSVVEAPPATRTSGTVIPIQNNGEPKVITRTFTTMDDCQAARTSLLAFGFDIVLGTGGGATAHIGRSTSDCFHGLQP